METFTMSSKEAPRRGLLKAALAGQITNRQGAEALHITIRHFQRLKRCFAGSGIRALVHRGRGQPSPRRRPAALREQVARLLTTTYAGFNDCHFGEKLREVEGLQVSREFVRRVRVALGQAATRRRRAPRQNLSRCARWLNLSKRDSKPGCPNSSKPLACDKAERNESSPIGEDQGSTSRNRAWWVRQRGSTFQG